MLGNLQILRFFAATGVVLLHANFAIGGNHSEFGGVPVFFVLSGYVMCLVSNRSAGAFFADRIWRIVPAYWAATGLLVVGLAAWREASWSEILRSLFFIPYEDPRGGSFPVLGVGWTLNMEMYFYTLFALAILVLAKYAPILVGAAVVVISIVLRLTVDNQTLLSYYANPILYYFVIGIGLWYASTWILKRWPKIRLPSWIFMLSIPLYIACVLGGVELYVIVPSLVLIAIFTAKTGGDINWRPLLLLGAASYACYLLHTILLAAMRAVGIDISGTLIFTIVFVVASWAIAVVWYETIERFFAKLHRRWKQRRTTVTAVPALEKT